MRYWVFPVLACLLASGITLIPDSVHASQFPMTIDGTFQTNVFSNNSILANTTMPNDDIIVYALSHGSTNAGTCPLPTDTAHLVWNQRISFLVDTVFNIYEFWTLSNTILTNDNITVACTPTGTFTDVFIQEFGVNGALSPSLPWDNPSSAVSANGTSTIPTVAISIKSASQDMIIAQITATYSVLPGATAIGPGTGYTQLGGEARAGVGPHYYDLSEYSNSLGLANGVNTIQPSNITALGNWETIADAIVGPATGGRTPGQNPFQSVAGPGGLALPPQLADQNVLGYVFLLSAGIALSSIRLERKKKTDRRLRLG